MLRMVCNWHAIHQLPTHPRTPPPSTALAPAWGDLSPGESPLAPALGDLPQGEPPLALPVGESPPEPAGGDLPRGEPPLLDLPLAFEGEADANSSPMDTL